MERIFKPRMALAGFEVVDEATRENHLTAFVQSFVVREKKARWIQILNNKPDKARRDGHNIIGDLDYRWDSMRDLKNLKQKGVYYEFTEKALWLPTEDALSIGQQQDAIFSIEPGKLAVFFFHEFRLFEEIVFERG